ncbi:LPXTG cell wall anchor domain-containing protein [Sphingobacterium sp. Mn56C]|uniref:LPXTG cell wall anchor domain-containing protein n=1 Tax=Sphingobacterium sp. Mn56C TaxID=3395261 RepID=UPI003BDD9CB9
MRPKTIIISLLLALVAIILFNNTEESSFWLFGEIKTSKLIILGVFFVLGVVTGGILFRRRKKHPKEYGLSNPNPNPTLTETAQHTQQKGEVNAPYATKQLSDEDSEFLKL